MLKRKTTTKVFAATLTLIGLIGASSANAASSHGHYVATDHHSCTVAKPGLAGCLAIHRTVSVNGITPRAASPRALVEPNGKAVFGASALRQAYGVNLLGSQGNTIAIVDAYHAETALTDLNTYRATWGYSPLVSCSKGLPCFTQLHQNGSEASGATTDEGWAQETVLDLEMATAMCPNCSLTVVEANTADFADFNDAVDLASSLPKVIAISNSYGGPEVSESDYPAYESAYQKGIAVVASSGDSGFGVESPASFQHVIAVGGTTLAVTDRGTYQSESAWAGAGSGCSRGSAPEWQLASLTHCSGKAVADVSAVANPATGVAVMYNGQWMIFGGTSASAPLIAGILAARHNYGQSVSAGKWIWDHRNSLHDIANGANGACRKFCKSVKGWDGPTGLGSPRGTIGF
jgi:subtilase family serine protease